MSGTWQLARDRKKYGPYPWEQLCRMAAAGQVLPTDMLLRDGETRWQTAREVPGLFAPPAALPPAAPVLPTASPVHPAAVPTAHPPAAHPPAAAPLANAAPVAAPVSPAASPTASVPPAAPATVTAAAVGDKISGAFGSMFGKIKSSITAAAASAGSKPVEPSTKEAKPPVPAAPTTPPVQPPPEGTVLSVDICCQGGHPEHPDKAAGILFLTKEGLVFRTEAADRSWQLPFERLVDVLEPRVGSWPEEMVKRAKNLQNAAQASRFAMGIAGSMMGGMEGAILRTAGSTAAGVAGQSTKLGPPPHNRVILVLLHQGTKYAVRCDVLGKTGEAMEKGALDFRVKAMEFRPRFARTAAAGGGRGRAASAVLPAGTFRAMIQGTVVGPLSAEEVLTYLREGKLGADDMIGMETWLPVSSLASLVPGGPSPVGAGGNAQGPAAAAGVAPGAPARGGIGTGTVVAAGVAGVAAGAVLGVAASRAFAGSPAAAPGAPEVAQAGSGAGAKGEMKLVDRDGDGRPDAVVMDRDGDGRADAVGLDTDGDGRIDTVGLDEDQDGQVDVLGLDTDGDGDVDVVGLDTDHDGEIDAYGADLDDDGGMDVFGDMDEL